MCLFISCEREHEVTESVKVNVFISRMLTFAIVFQAIQQLQARSPHAQSTANTVTLAVFLVGAALDIFQTLIVELDTEGRYLFLNAVANQLRYPNTHTHYFSFVLLYLFAESTQVSYFVYISFLVHFCLLEL